MRFFFLFALIIFPSLVFADVDYSRIPDDFSNETFTSDFEFLFIIGASTWEELSDGNSGDYWTVYVKNLGESLIYTDCNNILSSTTLGGMFQLELPVDEYTFVAVGLFDEPSECDPYMQPEGGGIELEYLGDEIIFEVISSPEPPTPTGVTYGFTPLFETATSTCSTLDEVTTCIHTYPLQISYLDWIQVNGWVIFLLSLIVVGQFFSLARLKK